MFVAVASLVLTLASAAPAPTSVLILPMRLQGEVPAHLGDLCAEVLAATLRKTRSLSVVTHNEIEDVLTQEQKKMLAGCTSDACATEIAGALNAQELIRGTLGRLGDSYVLTLARIHVRNAQALGSAVRQFAVDDEEALSRLAPDALAELYPKATELRSFRVGKVRSARHDDEQELARERPAHPLLEATRGTLRLAGAGGLFFALVGTAASLLVLAAAVPMLTYYLVGFYIPSTQRSYDPSTMTEAEARTFQAMATGGSFGTVAGLVGAVVAVAMGLLATGLVVTAALLPSGSKE